MNTLIENLKRAGGDYRSVLVMKMKWLINFLKNFI